MHLSIVTSHMYDHMTIQVYLTLCSTQPAIPCVVMQRALSVEVGNQLLLLWHCTEMQFVAIQRIGGGVLRVK